MIRILHTADWHIGQTLRGFSREHEHRKVFERLEEIVVERDVDALIIAGDVFDSQNPSGEAQQLFYNTLMRLSRANPRMAMVIAAGNHDAAGRLEAPRPLWRHSTSASWAMCGGAKGESRRPVISFLSLIQAVRWLLMCLQSPTQPQHAFRI